MRTHIVVDDGLVAEAIRLTGIKTKREVVDAALRTLVRLERQRAVLALEGNVRWEENLDTLRMTRPAAAARRNQDVGIG